jgi:ketosteroid isomerase-like protein
MEFMSSEEIKALVRRYFEDGPSNPDICDEIFAPRIHWHAMNHTIDNPDFDSDPQSEKAAYAWLKTVWGDYRFIIHEVIAEADRVMVHWTFQGTQQGEFQGLPPTNLPVTYAGINIFRIVDGRIAEIWDMFDRLWLWQQLGALPETAEFIARSKNRTA